MKTPDEIRTELSDARKKVLTVIEATPEGNWKKLPSNGPDEWNIQQVVEHIIDVEIILTTRVCKSCGYPGPESPFSDKGPQCPTRESAIEAFNMAVEVSNSKIKYVTETDLAIESEVDVLVFYINLNFLDQKLPLSLQSSISKFICFNCI